MPNQPKREDVTEFVLTQIADIFDLDKDYITADPNLRFRQDLHARSMQYFPLISMIEDEYDLYIDTPHFQLECATVGDCPGYVMKLYEDQHS